MEPSGRIALTPWMDAPQTVAVLDALEADGARVRFVGGCVRDALLGRDVGDIDIATPDEPQTVIALLEKAGIKAVPTGIDHGTITAVKDGHSFEVTTLRHDVETFGRHARVAFTDDWLADAARRDFTMNALFCDGDGTLYDPCGGAEDLKCGRVRFVGDPHERIAEDVLRILRFFRFQAHYGQGGIDDAALTACRDMADRLPGLSAERIWKELRRLLEAPDPVPVLGLMAENNVLVHVLPEIPSTVLGGHQDFPLLKGLLALVGSDDPVLRLAAILIASHKVTAEMAEKVAVDLRMSNAEKSELLALVSPRHRPDPDSSPKTWRADIYRLGSKLFLDLALLGQAGRKDTSGDAAGYGDMRNLAANWAVPDFPLSGKDVLALGLTTGEGVGRLLDEMEDWWIRGDFAADRAACLSELERRISVPP